MNFIKWIFGFNANQLTKENRFDEIGRFESTGILFGIDHENLCLKEIFPRCSSGFIIDKIPFTFSVYFCDCDYYIEKDALQLSPKCNGISETSEENEYNLKEINLIEQDKEESKSGIKIKERTIRNIQNEENLIAAQRAFYKENKDLFDKLDESEDFHISNLAEIKIFSSNSEKDKDKYKSKDIDIYKNILFKNDNQLFVLQIMTSPYK